MTSIFDTAFANAQNKLFDTFGVIATYNSTDITVCVESYDSAIEQYPQVSADSVVIQVRSSDVSDPSGSDTVTLDGTTYQVSHPPLRRDSLGSTLELTKQMVRL